MADYNKDSGAAVYLATYPYAHISTLLFENSINAHNGIKNGQSNVNIELTNAGVFGKHGYVRFHWLSGVVGNAFSSDDVIGEPVNLSHSAVAQEVKILVPLDLLKKASDNGGRAGIYYQYVESDTQNPVDVGKPLNTKDNTAGKSQTFDININGLQLNLLAPIPEHTPITANDLTVGYTIKIPDYARKKVGQTIMLHWKQDSQDTSIGPYSIESVDIGGAKAIVLNNHNIPNPKNGPVKLYYTVTDGGDVATSPTVTVNYGGSVTSESGYLYGAGWHGYCNLGDADTDTKSSALTELTSEQKVKFLPHGSGRYTHSAIGEDGKLYCWGANDWNESGTGHSGRQVRQQAEFVGGRPDIVFVSNGSFHTLALEADGTLWGAGCMRNGRLTLGAHSDDRYVQFTKTTTGRKFSFVSAAGSGGGEWDGFSSLGIGKDDAKLYGWGASDTGVLGQGRDSVPDTYAPALVESSRTWSWVAHNYYRAAGITTSGELFTWGNENGSGVLGRGTTGGKVRTPTEVAVTDGTGKSVRFSKVVTGQEFMIALDTQGRVWGWGKNWYFDLAGAGTQDQVGILPTLIPGLEGTFVDIAADFASAAAVNANGVLYVWGNNVRGQLGLGVDNEIVSKPTIVKAGTSIRRISFGCYSLFALAD